MGDVADPASVLYASALVDLVGFEFVSDKPRVRGGIIVTFRDVTERQRAVMLRVQELSVAMGSNLYLTGGTVRDLITGASLRDLDFTVEGNPSRIARELEKGARNSRYCLRASAGRGVRHGLHL